MVRHTTLLLVTGAALLAGCSSDDRAAEPTREPRTTDTPREPRPAATTVPAVLEPRGVWEPSEGEPLPNAKRLASRFAQAVTTYPVGSERSTIAAEIRKQFPGITDGLGEPLDALVDGRQASAGEVVYPQLSGQTETSAGVMVLVRQTTLAPGGERRSVTRVLDVRLDREIDGRWRVRGLRGIGGREVPRPDGLSAAARRAVDHPRLEFSDSARWDIYRGEVDDALLRALSDAADVRRLSILVLRSGHPREVWATPRRSAHHAGRAADVYAVSGQLVVRQRRPGSSAYLAAEQLVQRGAAQIGSPWMFGGRTFTDLVHQDHLHVHWTAGVPPEG